jgi:hypothetical protein
MYSPVNKTPRFWSLFVANLSSDRRPDTAEYAKGSQGTHNNSCRDCDEPGSRKLASLGTPRRPDFISAHGPFCCSKVTRFLVDFAAQNGTIPFID